MRAHQRGQATPLMAVALALAGLVALGLAHMGSRAVHAAEARTAADAAALAGAAEGREAAEALAGENGAVLVGFEQIDDDVLVTVSVDGVRAQARARLTWPSDDGP